MGAAIIIIFLAIIAAGVPIAIAMGSVSLIYFFLTDPNVLLTDPRTLLNIPQRMVAGVNSFPLMAIPFFIFAGELMNTGGVTDRIFSFGSAMLGRRRGGLAYANIFASIIFAGISGSALADAGGLGTVEIKAMKDRGYEPGFACGITAASSTIGPIIPPSILMVVYGALGEVSIGRLFLGGVVPGIVMGVLLAIMVYVLASIKKIPREEGISLRHFLKIFVNAIPPLFAPLIIVGGIVAGIVTPTEAAMIAVIYAIFLGTVLYRELGFRNIFRVFGRTILNSGDVLFITAAASLFANVLTREEIPQMTAAFLTSISNDPLIILFIINGFVLMLGLFLDQISGLILVLPIFLPVIESLGISPVFFGVILVLGLCIGLITPPVGLCLYVTAEVGGISIESLIRNVFPFVLALVVCLYIITIFPQLVLFLPNLLMGKG
jgi:tripartite ATP-independent transporter DctM subunit